MIVMFNFGRNAMCTKLKKIYMALLSYSELCLVATSKVNIVSKHFRINCCLMF